MTRLLLSTLLLFTIGASAVPVMGPPDRRIYLTSGGDLLEWQPGFGYVVVTARAVHTRTVTKRRSSISDGKAIISVERPRVDRPRARVRVKDEGESLMEEVEPLE
jgi:hypothetical protein